MVMATDLNQKLCPNSPTHDMGHAQNKQKNFFFWNMPQKFQCQIQNKILLKIVWNTLLAISASILF